MTLSKNQKNVFKTSVSGNFEAEIENDFQINKAKGSLNAFDFLYLNETITKPINLKKMKCIPWSLTHAEQHD